MLTNIVLPILACITIFGYIIYTCVKRKEIPESISAIVYGSPMNLKWTFAAVMFVSAMLLMPTLLEKASGNTEFLAFLTIAGIVGVRSRPPIYRGIPQAPLHCCNGNGYIH